MWLMTICEITSPILTHLIDPKDTIDGVILIGGENGQGQELFSLLIWNIQCLRYTHQARYSDTQSPSLLTKLLFQRGYLSLYCRHQPKIITRTAVLPNSLWYYKERIIDDWYCLWQTSTTSWSSCQALPLTLSSRLQMAAMATHCQP